MALYPWVRDPTTVRRPCNSVTVDPITVAEVASPPKCILRPFLRISVFFFLFHLLVSVVDLDSMLFYLLVVNVFNSELLHVKNFLANRMEGERDETSPMPTFNHSRIGEVESANEGHSTSILQHIGLIEDGDQDVFGDALDDRPTPISPTPLMIEERIVPSLIVGITPTTSSQRLTKPTKNKEDHRNLKAVSVRGLKSSARRKTQQGGEEAPSFNLWRKFSRTTEEQCFKQCKNCECQTHLFT